MAIVQCKLHQADGKLVLVMPVHFCQLFYDIGQLKCNQFDVSSDRIG